MIFLLSPAATVKYEELSLLTDAAIESQTDLLKEDMFQIEFPSGFLLDVGWFPSFSVNGGFQIRVIKHYKWEAPIILLTADSTPTLHEALVNAQRAIIEEIEKINTI